MIKLNQNTPTTDLKSVKIGDEVTDGLSKAGRVHYIEQEPRSVNTHYIFTLENGEKILVIR